MKFLLLILSMIICSLNSFAQGINPVLDVFNFESGLTSNEIRCIAQDKDEFLWIGTSGGLNRYDGNSFVQYFKSKDSNSIADNRINDLCTLPRHILAIATANGLNFLDTHTGIFKTFRINDYSRLSLFHNYFTRLCVDKNGNVWAGSQTDLLVFNSQLQLIHSFPGNYTVADINRKILQWVEGMYVLPDGRILVSQNKESVVYDPNTFTASKISQETNTVLAKLIQKVPNLLLYDMNHQFWYTLPGKDSFFSCDYSKGIFNSYPLFKNANKYFKWFSNLYSFDDTSFYMGIADTGFFKLTIEKSSLTLSHIDNLPPSNDQTVFFRDHQNNLWIGTKEGLYEWSAFKNQFQSINLDQQHPPSDISCFFRSNNEMWMGSYGKSIYRYDLKTREVDHINLKLPHTNLLSEVWNISKHRNDTLWIGTQEGLIWFIPAKNIYGRLCYPHPAILDSFPITTQFTDSEGCVWMGVGIGHGVVCFNPQKNSFTIYNNQSTPPFPLRHPTAITEDEHGNLWMGTQRGGGLVQWNRTANTFSVIPANGKENFIDDRINTIYADHHSHIWMGTNYAGVISYDIDKSTFEIFGRENGLSNENIVNINGSQYPYLWMTSMNGLNRLDVRTGKIESFFKKDGLPADAIDGNIYYDSLSNSLYAGYPNGTVSFNVTNFILNDRLPQVFISGITINDHPLHEDLSKPISLTYKQNNLTVNFTAIDLVNGSDLKFRYRLGNEQNWNMARNNREIHFSNLSPGDYSLVIEVANKAGVWNEKATTLNFYITPPFWNTTWFYFFAAVCIIVIVYSLYRFRIKQLQRVQEMRNRIAQDLHDDIGGTITAMNLTNELAIQNLHEPTFAKQLLTNISEDLKNAGETLDDIVWTVNPKNDSMEEVMARMRRYASHTWEAKGIDFNFDFDKNAEVIHLNMEQRHDLYLVFKEAVNNAAKHSQCTQASSSVSLSDHSLFLEITDNGKGFDVNTPSHRNGIKNMQSRLQKWKGEFNIFSSEKGTSIKLRMPITQKSD